MVTSYQNARALRHRINPVKKKHFQACSNNWFFSQERLELTSSMEPISSQDHQKLFFATVYFFLLKKSLTMNTTIFFQYRFWRHFYSAKVDEAENCRKCFEIDFHGGSRIQINPPPPLLLLSQTMRFCWEGWLHWKKPFWLTALPILGLIKLVCSRHLS